MHRTTIKKGGGLGAAPVVEVTEALIGRARPGDIPALVAELERLKTIAFARLMERREDRFITTAEASRLTGLSRATLYRRADELPFGRRVGGRSVRFSLLGIEDWQRQKEEEVR
jgi:predicted DNA-binding transcriptional regulator AlpA